MIPAVSIAKGKRESPKLATARIVWAAEPQDHRQRHMTPESAIRDAMNAESQEIESR